MDGSNNENNNMNLQEEVKPEENAVLAEEVKPEENAVLAEEVKPEENTVFTENGNPYNNINSGNNMEPRYNYNPNPYANMNSNSSSAPVVKPPEEVDERNVTVDYIYTGEKVFEVHHKKNTYDGLCVTAFVIALCSFFIDPLFIPSLAAIVLGIIGQVKNGPKRSLAMWGWILGITSLIVQAIIDSVMSFISGGLGCCLYML